ncbi:sigma-70 family RNA polymerase sigma factor [Christiangramia sp.]|uniref:RNA polymerase sigma factor n=1 Tax=Christiangramia sp. TaxID=1931228 RepID=UPI002637A71C|nr:sigma-70 family RNA polymerase sigma factor [Christiangramia sp.]
MRDSFNQRNFHLLKNGDPIALVNIYARYRRQLFWIGKQKMSDEFVIESLVQDAFLKLWEHRERIEDPDHIYYFLRYVIKTECTYYYCRPKNQFYRSMARLENFGNYQEFMLGYDPNIEDEHLKDQCLEQEAFDRIKEILPLLSSEKSHLIKLCLKHGFRYKYIGQLMGKGVTETSNQVKKTIQEIKAIITHGSSLENSSNSDNRNKAEEEITEQQQRVLQLRCEQKESFSAIAKELNLSQKEVHSQFIAAYKLMQQKHEQQLKSA